MTCASGCGVCWIGWLIGSGAPGGDDYKVFQERFRIRRATEMCRGLGGDLRAGTVSGRHAELTNLRDAAGELGQSIERAQQHAF